MWQTNFADVIKLMNLRWGRLSWIFREGLCNPKGPTKRMEAEVKKERRCYTAGPKGRKGTSQGM